MLSAHKLHPIPAAKWEVHIFLTCPHRLRPGVLCHQPCWVIALTSWSRLDLHGRHRCINAERRLSAVTIRVPPMGQATPVWAHCQSLKGHNDSHILRLWAQVVRFEVDEFAGRVSVGCLKSIIPFGIAVRLCWGWAEFQDTCNLEEQDFCGCRHLLPGPGLGRWDLSGREMSITWSLDCSRDRAHGGQGGHWRCMSDQDGLQPHICAYGIVWLPNFNFHFVLHWNFRIIFSMWSWQHYKFWHNARTDFLGAHKSILYSVSSECSLLFSTLLFYKRFLHVAPFCHLAPDERMSTQHDAPHQEMRICSEMAVCDVTTRWEQNQRQKIHGS